MSSDEREILRQKIRQSAWNDRLGDHLFEIEPTASADPELSSRVPGGPLFATYQWHRTAWYDDPDI